VPFGNVFESTTQIVVAIFFCAMAPAVVGHRPALNSSAARTNILIEVPLFEK